MKKWYAILGDPIAQSTSPQMHSTWFEEMEIDAAYIPVHAKTGNLEEVVKSLKTLGYSGGNVTVPHKAAIIPYCDRLEPAAEMMNAVNTINVLPDGTWVGSNTDGLGFVRALEDEFGDKAKNTPILVIGAGGAARSIADALSMAQYGSLTFTNRTIEKAEQLAKTFSGADFCSLEEAEKSIADFGLIVQTTNVGMNFSQEGMPLNPAGIAAGTIAVDIIYNPLETEFLRTVRENGGLTSNGIGMFVQQGAISFETWTGVKPDTKTMMQKISAKVGG